METTTDRDEFARRADEQYGYAPRHMVRAAVDRVLDDDGDDVVLYVNADLGSLAHRPLCTVQQLPRDMETPRQAPDNEAIGPGWRYLPELRLTVEAS